tara:strand:- start:640 stop:1074 length:435 start_codon:yes stop_codon:yes gene_type:complete
MPFISERQRDYLRREHPAVYRRFLRDERSMGFELSAPADVAAVARRGLEARERYGRGGTLVGARRARQLAERQVVSIDTIKRMVAYFTRHAIDLEAPAAKPGHPDYPSAGRIAWDLWGGALGRAWARRQLAVWERVQSAREEER